MRWITEGPTSTKLSWEDKKDLEVLFGVHIEYRTALDHTPYGLDGNSQVYGGQVEKQILKLMSRLRVTMKLRNIDRMDAMLFNTS